MKRSGVRINKKFIIIASLVIVLLLGIYYVYYKINLTPIETGIKEITSLKQGTYESFYPSTIPYIILAVENDEYILYENTEKLTADILKVAHHGSKSSSIAEFLEKVNPRIALIGVGKNNKFGHPNAGVLDRLNMLRNKNI